MLTSCFGVFSMLQQGVFDVGMLSGAQVTEAARAQADELLRVAG